MRKYRLITIMLPSTKTHRGHANLTFSYKCATKMSFIHSDWQNSKTFNQLWTNSYHSNPKTKPSEVSVLKNALWGLEGEATGLVRQELYEFVSLFVMLTIILFLQGNTLNLVNDFRIGGVWRVLKKLTRMVSIGSYQ